MVTIVDTLSNTPLRPRHPEKANRPDSASPPKPDWIRVRAPNTRGYADTRNIAPNTTPEGRVENRRVTVLILPEKKRTKTGTGRSVQGGITQALPRPIQSQ